MWRLLDTGTLPAAQNMALDAVLLDACARGGPPTLRFMRFDPPAVLVGAFQRVEDEVREDWCRASGIHVNRRSTGGGAIFCDRSQIGWEIVCRWEHTGLEARSTALLFERFCSPVVDALRGMGVDAAFRPRNDIEVRGRKISGTGGTEAGGALLFQGTLLVDFDVETMARALRVPVEKLRRHELESMAERVTWLARELGGTVPSPLEIQGRLASSFERMMGFDLEAGGLTDDEQAALGCRTREFEADSWVRGRGRRGTMEVRALYPAPGGMLRPVVRTDESRRRIEAIVLDGDFFAFPARSVIDLEASLKGAAAHDVGRIVRGCFRSGRITIPGIEPDHVIEAIAEALGRAGTELLGLTPAQANGIFLVGGGLGRAVNLRQVARLGPTHLLLPYCAKRLECENRRLETCQMCGQCLVGEAYGLGAGAGLQVLTVTSFEHLLATLEGLRRSGAPAFLGSCCEAFYVKHRRELEACGVPGILFDVAGSETCYDLGKGTLAYQGRFEGESEMDVGLLDAVLGACREASCRLPAHASASSLDAPDRFDVIVVGAGPAGSSAALAAARAGARTVLLERHAQVGRPVRCAEFVPALLVHELARLGVDVRGCVAQRTQDIVLHLPGGSEHRLRAPGAVLDRDAFDTELARTAVGAGATLVTSTPVLATDAGGAVHVGGARPRRLLAATVIAADGPCSTASLTAGLGRQELMLATQIVAKLVAPVADAHLWFSEECRFGYGWLFPKGRHANVGVAVEWRRPDLARASLRSLTSNLVHDGIIEQPLSDASPLPGCWGFVPSGGPLPVTARGAMLLAGDAAGQVDPLTGAGIMWAARCGEIAGRVAGSGLRTGVSITYEREWRRAYSRYFARSLERRDRLRALWDIDVEQAVAGAWLVRAEKR